MALVPDPKEAAMPTTPTAANRGLLPAGTVLPGFGTIVRQSDTAYLVEWREACAYGHQRCEAWLSFDAVHGRPAPVMPLVVLA